MLFCLSNKINFSDIGKAKRVGVMSVRVTWYGKDRVEEDKSFFP